MPLRITARPGRAGLYINGTVTPAGGKPIEVRRRAGSDDPRLAAEEAAAITARILRDAHHGERPGTRGWAEAVASYLAFDARSLGTKALLFRLTRHFRDDPLHDIDQTAVDRACRILLRADAKPSTILRNVVVPIRAVMLHAARRKWCEAPLFEAPRQPEGRTPCLTPAQYLALYDAIAPQHRPLLTWLVTTGCRRGETWALQWLDVDLHGGTARLWGDTTKAGRGRVVKLAPATVAMLAMLPRTGVAVFPAADPRKALATAARRAGVAIRGVHDLRHTWASWHYALDRDLLALKEAGGWASTAQVETYAHRMPAGQDAAIRRVWGIAPGPHHQAGIARKA